MNICPSCDDKFDTERAMKIHHTNTHGESLAKESSECESCGSTFNYYPSSKPGLYCSNCVESGEYIDTSGLSKSRGLSGKDNNNYKGGKYVDCSNCGEDVWVSPWKLENNKDNFCSTNCVNEYKSQEYQGDGNPYWKGGYNPNYSDGWWNARREALKRDSYKCQLCGDSESFDGRNCDVHHKKPVREFEEPSNAHFLDNLITLCRSCHSNVENGNRKI